IGYRRHLERNDIWTVTDARLMDTLQPSLHAAFRKRVLARNRLPLLWALYEVFKFGFWLGAVSQFVVSTPQVMTPFTLRFLIEWVQHVYPDGHDTRGSTPVAAGIGYVLGIAVLQMLQTFASSQFYYQGMLLSGQTRSVLIAMTFMTYATRPLVASRNRINIVTDQRVTLTQETLQSIRFAKYFGWEGFFQDRLGNIRASET
ncbi:hypothetical protein FocTR4_00008179, partial [Fusarium oxysporum f. sp. cubense]